MPPKRYKKAVLQFFLQGSLIHFFYHTMKYLKYVLFSLLFLVYFTVYRGALSHVITYHEQHHLFLYSTSYRRQIFASEGWLEYVTNFVIQFFYNPTAGSVILALILASVYFLTDRIIRIFIEGEEPLQPAVVPSLCLFFYTMSVDHSLKTVVGVFLLLLLINLLLLFVRPQRKIVRWPQPVGRYGRIWLTVILLTVYAAGGYVFFLKSYSVGERIMLKAEQAAKAEDWNKVLEYTENYLNRGRSNHLIAYFHNLALYHTGSLPYRLFDYPQALGVKSLYFPWDGNSRESEYGYLLYEKLGYLNEAHRWEFEAMVVWGETAPHLLNLARYNLSNGRPRVAQRFINLLKQSLFYRDEALRLEQLAGTSDTSLPRNALPNVDDIPARFSNVLNLGPELQYLCEKDTTNRMAFEYLMSHLLLSNHVERFAQNLPLMRRFAYPRLPQTYEEALYIYELGVGREKVFEMTGLTVGEDTKRRFDRYYRLAQAEQMEALQAEFGNTYWFYLNYISPYGPKVIRD